MPASILSRCAALLALSAAALAHAEPVVTYDFGASGFFGGGTLAGSLSATLQPTPATAQPPFGAGGGTAGLAQVSAFEARFSGNFALPDAVFDLGELLSVRIFDIGTFASTPASASAQPAILEIRAFDDESELALTFLFAASQELLQAFLPLAAPGAVAGVLVNHTPQDDGRRFTTERFAELREQADGGGSFPPQAVPEPGSAALSAAALLSALLLRRRRP